MTRLTGVALASALMFACTGRAAPGDAASVHDPEEAPPPAAVQETQPERGEEARS